MDSQGYLALCYALSCMFAVGVAAYAFVMGFRLRRKIGDTEAFITARDQVGPIRIGWSFFAGAVGAWAIASPASYASYAGFLGLTFYALASGLPFIMIAFAGEAMQRKVPHVLSLTDYIGWRFGMAAKTYVVILVLFNMSIALLAEFTTIGSIFKDFVGSQPYPMIIVIGVLTLAYTAYGGLLVSIYTDQIQGAVSLAFFGIVGVYVAATFRPGPLQTPPPCAPDTACISGTPSCAAFEEAGMDCPTSGYSAIFVMPASLFTATVFSEAMWQRAWASRDRKALHQGAILGCVGVVLVVFFSGLCGLLAAWAGLISYGSDTELPTNANLYLFQVLHGGQMPEISTVSNWIGVVCVVLATMMNEGAVDSIQNGMAAGITSYVSPMVKGWTLSSTRAVVVVLNSGLIGLAVWLVLGTVKVGVLELFLLANMLCCTSAFPVLAGLAESLHPLMGGASFLFSCLFSILCTCIYGVSYYNTQFPEGFEDPYIPGRTYEGGSLNSALFYTWIGNGYKWEFFMVPIGVAIGSVGLCAGVNKLLQRFAKTPAVPGLVAPATHPHLYPAAAAPDAGKPLEEKVGLDAIPVKGNGISTNGTAVTGNDVAANGADHTNGTLLQSS